MHQEFLIKCLRMACCSLEKCFGPTGQFQNWKSKNLNEVTRLMKLLRMFSTENKHKGMRHGTATTEQQLLLVNASCFMHTFSCAGQKRCAAIKGWQKLQATVSLVYLPPLDRARLFMPPILLLVHIRHCTSLQAWNGGAFPCLRYMRKHSRCQANNSIFL